ncbi:MAG: hydroxylase [Planctomycetes bacterium]|nr:hydroxylase [Planctomycetota bacterium]MCP4771157.1 hydroxylase [Planctomycetota bacterium]MCP4862116.1 hydroxylase [Planctomycetota bacterium]
MTTQSNDIHYLEIVSADPNAARDLYAGTYGLEFGDSVPELGNAFVASLPSGSLFAIRGTLAEHEKPVIRAYVRVDDIHQATEKAASLGAMIALPPTELPGQGTIAIYIHGDVEHGIWQLP